MHAICVLEEVSHLGQGESAPKIEDEPFRRRGGAAESGYDES